MTRFCIYCGVEDSSENPVVDGVCLKCRIKRRELYLFKEDSVHVDMCRICYAVRIGFKWVDTLGFEDAIRVVVEELLPGIIKPIDSVYGLHIKGYRLVTTASWRTVVELEITGFYGAKEFTVRDKYIIFFNPVKCPRCIMYDSRDFEAVIQIRGFSKSRVKKVVEKEFMSNKAIARDYIDAIEHDNGYDIFFYSKSSARKLARRLASRLNARIIESFEETGTRSGKQHTRLYISLKPRD